MVQGARRQPTPEEVADSNAVMLARAVERLKHLTRLGESDNLHGVAGVDLLFRGGRIYGVKKRFEGTDQ